MQHSLNLCMMLMLEILSKTMGTLYNIKTVVFVKPIGKTVKIGIVSRKAFLLVMRLYAVCGTNDGSNQKGFVNIYTATNRVNNFQKYPSSN